jgi:hypothetical protein
MPGLGLMDFDLVRPCKHCPFRTDCLEGWLSRGRASEIATALTRGQATFACHETTESGGAGRGREQHCAGALLVLERQGVAPPQLARVAERLGFRDPDRLDQGAPVFDSLSAFVKHHEVDRGTFEPCSVAEMGCLAPAGFAVAGGAVENFEPEGETVECGSCAEPVCEACSVPGSLTDDERICVDCAEVDYPEAVA